MEVRTLASTISDNFFYLVIDEGEALLIDPIDADVAVAAVKAAGVASVRVFNTHGHPDHVGGNDAVVAALGCEVWGTGHPTRFDVRTDRRLMDGDTVQVGQSSWDVIHAPGHTEGHLVLHTPGHLISGDIYFVGGCGHCRYGGDPGVLHETFTARLASIPDATRFYPGHDYAEKNLRFVLSIEPENAVAAERLEAAKSHPRAGGPFGATLGEERAYNPFHRTADPGLQERLMTYVPESTDLAVADPSERAFRTLRALRDGY